MKSQEWPSMIKCKLYRDVYHQTKQQIPMTIEIKPYCKDMLIELTYLF